MTPNDADSTHLEHRNLRDLGRLPTRDGERVVTPRLLFRGSTPARFEADDVQSLRSLNLRRVVDLRMSQEVAKAPFVPWATSVEVVHAPLFEVARDNWIAPTDQSPPATAARYFEMLQDGEAALGAVVMQLAATEAVPTLVTCTAGRDRTGIVVACLLDLLDVKTESIGADYARSDDFDPPSGRALAETMTELLALIRREYGSTQGMLTPYGVNAAMVGQLREQFLE